MAGGGGGDGGRRVLVVGKGLGWHVDPDAARLLTLEDRRGPVRLGEGPAVVAWVEQVNLSAELLIAALRWPRLVDYVEGTAVPDMDVEGIVRVTVELIQDWGVEALLRLHHDAMQAWPGLGRQDRASWQTTARHVWAVFGLPGPAPVEPAVLSCDRCADDGHLLCRRARNTTTARAA